MKSCGRDGAPSTSTVVRAVYQALLQRGATRSEREFSACWLGRAPNHLADTRGDLSVGTAAVLYIRLARAGHRDLASQVWSGIAAIAS